MKKSNLLCSFLRYIDPFITYVSIYILISGAIIAPITTIYGNLKDVLPFIYFISLGEIFVAFAIMNAIKNNDMPMIGYLIEKFPSFFPSPFIVYCLRKRGLDYSGFAVILFDKKRDVDTALFLLGQKDMLLNQKPVKDVIEDAYKILQEANKNYKRLPRKIKYEGEPIIYLLYKSKK